jgi:glycosyltransferase involved in cell wall biosynthesis
MTGEVSCSSISVFFPAYNDANSIGKLVSDAVETVSSITSDYEIIVINDGSSDNTQHVLNDLKTKYERLKVITHEVNRGYGGALRSGFAAASKELIFYTDGDGQYDVRELTKLIPLLTSGVDVVNGYKTSRTDRLNRKIIGGLYNRVIHILFRLPIRDIDCDFRLIRRKVLDKIVLITNSGSICVELIAKLSRSGAIFKEVGVSHYARQHGSSQFFTLRRISNTLVDVLSLWLNIYII